MVAELSWTAPRPSMFPRTTPELDVPNCVRPTGQQAERSAWELLPSGTAAGLLRLRERLRLRRLRHRRGRTSRRRDESSPCHNGCRDHARTHGSTATVPRASARCGLDCRCRPRLELYAGTTPEHSPLRSQQRGRGETRPVREPGTVRTTVHAYRAPDNPVLAEQPALHSYPSAAPDNPGAGTASDPSWIWGKRAHGHPTE